MGNLRRLDCWNIGLFSPNTQQWLSLPR